jgi:hypothetical protein
MGLKQTRKNKRKTRSKKTRGGEHAELPGFEEKLKHNAYSTEKIGYLFNLIWIELHKLDSNPNIDHLVKRDIRAELIAVHHGLHMVNINREHSHITNIDKKVPLIREVIRQYTEEVLLNDKKGDYGPSIILLLHALYEKFG